MINHNTLLALEAIYNFLKFIPNVKSKIFPKVKKIKAIYLNREGVMDFPLEKMYGIKYIESIEWRSKKFIEHAGADIIKTINNVKKGTVKVVSARG